MINREKVKDMTQMAVYESGRGEKELKISSFRRGDYVALQMIWSFVLGTVAFAILVLFFFLIKVEFIDTLNTLEQLKQFGIRISVLYIVFIAIYLTGTFVWARRRYKRCCENAMPFMKMLNRVSRSYHGEEE